MDRRDGVPGMLDELTILCYDDMCHLRKYLEKRRHTNPLYEEMLTKHLTVDKLHIKGHDLGGSKKGVHPRSAADLTYCGRYCDPRTKEHAAVLEGGNTSSSMQGGAMEAKYSDFLRAF